jgi:hypothetical protein
MEVEQTLTCGGGRTTVGSTIPQLCSRTEERQIAKQAKETKSCVVRSGYPGSVLPLTSPAVFPASDEVLRRSTHVTMKSFIELDGGAQGDAVVAPEKAKTGCEDVRWYRRCVSQSVRAFVRSFVRSSIEPLQPPASPQTVYAPAATHICLGVGGGAGGVPARLMFAAAFVGSGDGPKADLSTAAAFVSAAATATASALSSTSVRWRRHEVLCLAAAAAAAAASSIVAVLASMSIDRDEDKTVAEAVERLLAVRQQWVCLSGRSVANRRSAACSQCRLPTPLQQRRPTPSRPTTDPLFPSSTFVPRCVSILRLPRRTRGDWPISGGEARGTQVPVGGGSR